MPLAEVSAPPGFTSQATQTQSDGHWFDGNLVRWRFGLLEKIAGWRRLSTIPSFQGLIRRMHAWQDTNNHKNLLVATDFGIQLVVNDSQYELGAVAALFGGTNVYGFDPGSVQFTAAIGSRTINVSSTVIVAVGADFTLRMPLSLGGRIIPTGTVLTVTSAASTGDFTFEMPLPALYNEGPVYGIPFFTNTALNLMTCTFRAHGLTTILADTTLFTADTTLITADNETVFTFDLATSLVHPGLGVNFSAPVGTVVQVTGAPTVDTFNFRFGALGSGDGLGGQIYEGWSVNMTAPPTFTPAKLATVTIATPAAPSAQHQSWFLDNFGEVGLVLSTGGPLETFTPPIEDGPLLFVVGGDLPVSAPQSSNGMLVAMPQAQVILFGTEPIFGTGEIDPLLIRFSDVGSYTDWTATVSNQAGSYRLGRGSRIVGAIQAPQTTLIFTDTDVWGMSYIGPPLVYGFTVMGTGCGLIAPHAVVTLGRTTYWQSENGFWQFGEGGVQPIPCAVWDYIFQNLDRANINKCHLGANSSANEVMCFFPPNSLAMAAFTNQLLWSQVFSQTSKWSTTGAIAVFDTGITAPDGSLTASRLVELITNSQHLDTQEVFKDSTRKTYTLSVYAHNSSTRNLYLSGHTPVGGSAWAIFNPVTGTVASHGVTGSSFSYVSTSVTEGGLVANGWQRYALTFLSDDGASMLVSFGSALGTAVAYFGTGDNVAVWGAQVNLGTAPLAYQATTGTVPENETKYYVKLNPAEGHAWDKGVLHRSAWIDNSIWGPPLGGDVNFRIQQHELGYDDDDGPMRGVFVETGYAQIGDGSTMMAVDQCRPDFKWLGTNGSVDVRLKLADYSGGATEMVGPYPMTPTTRFFSPHVRAGHVAIRYEWAPRMGYSARVGATKFRVKPAGRLP